MALLDTTLQSPYPRETLKLVRSEVLAGLPSEAQPSASQAVAEAGGARSSLAQTIAMPAKAVLAQTVAMQANPAKVLAQTIALQSRPAKALVRTVAMQANPAKAVLTQTLYQAERPAHPSSGMVPVAAPLALAARAVAPVPAAAPAAMRACSPTADPRLMMLADPAGAQAGSFRVLRDTLVTKGIPRVLAITSPEPQDGKTTCAINLALALAERRSERILLIDANFADPALAGILGIDESADASPNRAWTAPFTLSALTPCLHVATIARRPGQSSAYVDFTTFARQLDTFQRAGYQHIILDMPTLDNSSEAKLLLELAGGVLLAVRCGRSKTGALKSAAARIAAGKALGITLLDSPS